jgi:hypothetical protein
VPVAPVRELADVPPGDARVAEAGGADLDGVRPGDQELEDVLDGLDAADPEDRDAGSALRTSQTIRRATGRIAGPKARRS